MAFTGRLKEMMKKYGKVAIVVHLSVSTASITGLYVAIKNNVDVEDLFRKVDLSPGEAPPGEGPPLPTADETPQPPPLRNRSAELAASNGGALALAILCNKALFPVRVPIAIALTPPIYRFLARRNLIRRH